MNAYPIRYLLGVCFACIVTLHLILLIWIGFENAIIWKSVGTFAIVYSLFLLLDLIHTLVTPRPEPPPATPPQDIDRELKELEVLNKRQELDVRRLDAAHHNRWLARWNNPVVLAVLAAVVGYMGTLITWSLARVEEQGQHSRTLDLEKTKQAASEKAEENKMRGALILDAMKTGDPKRAAANLLLFADAGLLSFQPETEKKLRDRAGDVLPGLPISHSDSMDDPAARVRDDVAYAVLVLNKLFNRTELLPEVKLLKGEQNAYYEIHRKVISISSDMSIYTPDVAYRMVAHMYQGDWGFDREPEALYSSIADALACYVQQTRLKQTAETADWVFARKWLSRSLKHPSVGHINAMVKGGSTSNEIHLNSGIPSKAFYEASMKLGTEQAAAIWAKALGNSSGDRAKFAQFALETAKQAEALQGAAGKTAIIAAWDAVGIKLAN